MKLDLNPVERQNWNFGSHHQQTNTAEDTSMVDDTTINGRSDANALKTISRDVNTPHSEFDLVKAAKKLICQNGSTDIGDARYQSSANSNSLNDTLHIPGANTDKTDRILNPPKHSGTQSFNKVTVQKKQGDETTKKSMSGIPRVISC